VCGFALHLEVEMLLPQLSALGWFHTLGSLPAVPLALYLLFRYGRIPPEKPLAKSFLVFMFVGALSGVLVIKSPPGAAISLLSLGSLTLGTFVSALKSLERHHWSIQTVALSTAVFTLFLPSVTEVMTRLPAARPIADNPEDPLVVAFQLSLLVILVGGVTLQLLFLRRPVRASVMA
jgi:predicted membrane channel-forming protein YqfA (hemolysin III family)